VGQAPAAQKTQEPILGTERPGGDGRDNRRGIVRGGGLGRVDDVPFRTGHRRRGDSFFPGLFPLLGLGFIHEKLQRVVTPSLLADVSGLCRSKLASPTILKPRARGGEGASRFPQVSDVRRGEEPANNVMYTNYTRPLPKLSIAGWKIPAIKKNGDSHSVPCLLVFL